MAEAEPERAQFRGCVSARRSPPGPVELAAARQIHWWYQHNRALAARLLVEHISPGIRALDAGAAAGPNGAWLTAFGDLFAVCPDAERVSEYISEAPSAIPAACKLDRLPFGEETFDVIVAISSMHDPMSGDPRCILDEYARVLRGNGAICLIEPEWHPQLDEPVVAGRYLSLPYLVGICEASGLGVDRATRANLSQRIEGLVQPDAVRLGTSDVQLDDLKWGTRLVRNSLWFVAALERTYLMSHDIGTGAGAVVVAHKPGN